MGNRIAVLFSSLLSRVECPRCATKMKIFRKPTSPRQMLLGGWTCHVCGCEMDRTGRDLDFPTEGMTDGGR